MSLLFFISLMLMLAHSLFYVPRRRRRKRKHNQFKPVDGTVRIAMDLKSENRNDSIVHQTPGIIIHDIPIDKQTVVDIMRLAYSLEKDKNNKVYLPFVLHNSKLESNEDRSLYSHLHQMYPQLPASLSIDKYIEFDVLMQWTKLFNSSQSLHVINQLQESEHDIFDWESLVNVSQYLPSPFASKLIESNIISYCYCFNMIPYA